MCKMVSALPNILTRLIPFNPHRFDACMAYLAQEVYRRPLNLFEMVKHHVMTDVFHVLETGHQAIGGEFKPWPYGPVVEDAYNRIKHWEHRHEETSGHFQPQEYLIFGGELSGFQPRAAFDPEDMAPSEIEAMDQAVRLLKPMSFDDAYRFFHDDGSYMGRAYNMAKAEGRSLAWNEIIDAYDAIHGTDHKNLKRRLISYG